MQNLSVHQRKKVHHLQEAAAKHCHETFCWTDLEYIHTLFSDDFNVCQTERDFDTEQICVAMSSQFQVQDIMIQKSAAMHLSDSKQSHFSKWIEKEAQLTMQDQVLWKMNTEWIFFCLTESGNDPRHTYGQNDILILLKMSGDRL